MLIKQRESLGHFTIERFRDGDTVEGTFACRCCGAMRHETIRLLHIDSFELNSAERDRAKLIANKLTVQYHGQRCTVVSEKVRRDKYHRLLTDLLIGNGLLSDLIVSAGDAWYLPKELPKYISGLRPPK